MNACTQNTDRECRVEDCCISGKQFISKMLERSYALNWCKGYLTGLDLLFEKLDQGVELRLFDSDIIDFVRAEIKIAYKIAKENYAKLENLTKEK